MFLLNARRPGREESKGKLIFGIILSPFNIYLGETWLDGSVSDPELQLKECSFYRAERPSTKNCSNY